MAISKRDQKTLTIILVLVFGFVMWSFGIEPIFTDYQTLAEKLDSEQKKFEENKKTLAEATSIDEGYAKVEAQFPKDDPDREPSEVFSEEVVDIVKEKVGVIPNFNPPVRADVKGAPGYEFLILPLTVKTTIDKMSGLLKEFESKGYLIQTTKATRESDLNKAELTIDINLGRIVKTIPDEPEEGAAPGAPGSLKLNRGRS